MCVWDIGIECKCDFLLNLKNPLEVLSTWFYIWEFEERNQVHFTFL